MSNETKFVCPKCHTELVGRVPSCPNCGAKFNWENAQKQNEIKEEEFQEVAEPKNPCPHCGKENTEGTRFCIHCGKAMFAEENARYLCPKCKAVFFGQPNECPECGTKFNWDKAPNQFIKTQKACPNCGSVMDAKANFCPECGINIGEYENGLGIIKVDNSVKEQRFKADNPKYNVKKLFTKRHTILILFLTVITLGIYGIWYICNLVNSMNRIVDEMPNENKQLRFLPMLLLGIITLGVIPVIWSFKLAYRYFYRAGKENLPAHGSMVSYVILSVLLSWSLVCPLIAEFQLNRTANEVCAWYNKKHGLEE